MYLRCMDPSFLLSVDVLQTVLEVTKPLSVKLQGVSQDILRTTESARDGVDVLQNFRSGDTFDRLFVQAEEVDGRPIQMQRKANRQRHRTSQPSCRLCFGVLRACFVQSIHGLLHCTVAIALCIYQCRSPSPQRTHTCVLSGETSPQLRKGCLPVTSVVAERSFSSLKYPKDYLRTRYDE